MFNFNKLLEVLIWSRISKWWVIEESHLTYRGHAGRGVCVSPTALTLQETITKVHERGMKVIVAYCDVLEAFDSVWVAYCLGVVDREWVLCLHPQMSLPLYES